LAYRDIALPLGDDLVATLSPTVVSLMLWRQRRARAHTWLRVSAAWLLVGAGALAAAAAAVLSSWPGVVMSAAVAAAGVIGGVLSSRGAARMAEQGTRHREVWRDLQLAERGRLPRVRELSDPADAALVFGPDHPHAITIRREVARFTGDTGDPAAALILARATAADAGRALGPVHRSTRCCNRAFPGRRQAASGPVAGRADPRDTA
jgi:hypothetical protein